MTIAQFRQIVWKYYRAHGRHMLPWRTKATAYHILVSEFMLQQTQVERVIPYYRAWLKRFPTIRALAEAPLSDVLIAWQGLGYNRRAKHLHQAAQAIVEWHKGKIPQTVEELEALPGIGPYTARAVAAFAYNQDVVLIETNVRTVFIHHFFADRDGVTDAEILTLAEKAFPKGKAREWYAALMDYGTHLKRSGVRTNARVKGYSKQKTFKGSDREARGVILKELAKKRCTKRYLVSVLGTERARQLELQLHELIDEGFVVEKGMRYELPS